MLTSEQIQESERFDEEYGKRPDCRRESLTPRIRAPRTARSERERLEREALDYLLAWHTEKDPSKRSAAWHRLIAATNELAEFESQHLLKK